MQDPDTLLTGAANGYVGEYPHSRGLAPRTDTIACRPLAGCVHPGMVDILLLMTLCGAQAARSSTTPSWCAWLLPVLYW